MAEQSERSYRELDPERIVATIARLVERIEKRFPGSGLGAVCRELLGIARRTSELTIDIARPNIALRLAVAFLVAVIGAVVVSTAVSLRPSGDLEFADFVQVLEAGINDIVLIGLGIFFLVSLERRLKRARSLAAIHELRSLAHIIDMHQLTKDPDRLLWQVHGLTLDHATGLSPFQLTRYLDYSSEMLSLVGKVAVLHVQRFDDPVALAAVNDVENLTTGLSRKIWQKVMVLHADPKLLRTE